MNNDYKYVRILARTFVLCSNCYAIANCVLARVYFKSKQKILMDWAHQSHKISLSKDASRVQMIGRDDTELLFTREIIRLCDLKLVVWKY